jgi:hypothetical protein
MFPVFSVRIITYSVLFVGGQLHLGTTVGLEEKDILNWTSYSASGKARRRSEPAT